MRNPFRRQAEPAAPTLRERAADLRASLARPTQPEPVAPEREAEAAVDWHSPPPGFMASPAIEPESFARIPDGITIELQRLRGIALAEFERRTEGEATGPEAAFIRRELRLDVLSMASDRLGQHPTAGGIAHGDGTISFTDASGVVLRAPMAHWVGFVATQMHSLVQGEIGRQRVAANALDPEAYEAWEEGAQRDLRSDAVHALAFHHLRAFEDAQALRIGAEPVDWSSKLSAGFVRDIPALGDADPAGVQSPDFLAAAGIDLKAMPLRDLIALHSSANLLGDVADAISCQPKSTTRGGWNAAGSMVNWLGDGLSGAIEAAAVEIRTRGASDGIEQGHRLASLAPAILEGGNPAAALALAREILAAVKV